MTGPGREPFRFRRKQFHPHCSGRAPCSRSRPLLGSSWNKRWVKLPQHGTNFKFHKELLHLGQILEPVEAPICESVDPTTRTRGKIVPRENYLRLLNPHLRPGLAGSKNASTTSFFCGRYLSPRLQKISRWSLKFPRVLCGTSHQRRGRCRDELRRRCSDKAARKVWWWMTKWSISRCSFSRREIGALLRALLAGVFRPQCSSRFSRSLSNRSTSGTAAVTPL